MGGAIPYDQVESNARLIAAAPQLAEALRACRDCLLSKDADGYTVAAAAAKAREALEGAGL